tara:strand:+ start:313 stop:456 length:144 start_codon:yes stop_codon:yes gene_type:complete
MEHMIKTVFFCSLCSKYGTRKKIAKNNPENTKPDFLRRGFVGNSMFD